MTAVRRATASDSSTLGATIASAFADDPVFSWMLGPNADPEQNRKGNRQQKLTPFFTSLAKINLAKSDHEIYISESGDGAAIWYGVDDWKVAPTDLVRSAPALVRTFGRRLPVALKALSAMEKAHPTAPHYYLEFLGTRRDRQGRGVGSMVIAPMLERCDAEAMPAYLENSNPRNEAFYARHGFVVRQEIALPADAPPLVAMWREPRTL